MKRHVCLSLLLGVLMPSVAYLAVRAFVLAPPPSPFERLGIDPASINPDTLPPRIASELGLITALPTVEYVVLVISASSCPASATEGLDDAIRTIRGLVRDQLAGRAEAVERMVGVAVDQDALLGVEHLATLSDFDEIVAGGGWMNTATEKYLWSEQHDLPGITPQIVLLERTVRYVAGAPIVEKERVTRVVSGADEILEWISNGAPVEKELD